MPFKYPKKVRIGDITVRDGFQHEEKTVPTRAKIWLVEQMVLAGIKRVEVTNLGNPVGMPQFADADAVLKGVRESKALKGKLSGVDITAVTIREKAAERAIEARKAGWGPDRILFMVSTSASHHKANSGISLDEYWAMAERYIPLAHDVGMKVCGTVSTIWGCPIEGPTELKKAVEFSERWLKIGADDIEHADHDGSAPPNKVFEYFSMVLDRMPNTDLHIGHFHVSRGWGLANVLAAMQAGIDIFEGTFGGIGGQPANFVDGSPVAGTGKYYYDDPNKVGLVTMEDLIVMMDEMGIELGIDVDKILEIGRMVEKIVGRPLRSEAILNGRIPKTARPQFAR
ncbi:MAG: pyruvate carboxyltransferase [Dehalococcoidia bacterium]|nr:pyruvate carboxyltransferase [Dehalococcoidia bacterium]